MKLNHKKKKKHFKKKRILIKQSFKKKHSFNKTHLFTFWFCLYLKWFNLEIDFWPFRVNGVALCIGFGKFDALNFDHVKMYTLSERHLSAKLPAAQAEVERRVGDRADGLGDKLLVHAVVRWLFVSNVSGREKWRAAVAAMNVIWTRVMAHRGY